MKLKFILLLPCLNLCYLHAQSLTPQIYATSGSHFVSGTSQLTFTIGEPQTFTYNGSSVIVTQGFNQPETSTSSIDNSEAFTFNIYPNPSQEFIVISSTNSDIQEINVELIDINGKVVKHFLGYNLQQPLNISYLADGTYHLRITYNKDLFNSFTIIKTTKN